MKRQAFLFLALLSLTPGCVLDIDVLDGAADELGETDNSESSTSTTDAESSTSTTDAESSTSTTDAESSSSTTDAESSSSTTDAESSSSTTDATTTESTTLSDAPPDCAEAQAEYEALVGMTECITDADCKIIAGHCSVGLGGCYYAVNASVDEAFLDLLAQVWSDGGCTQGVCDCAEPPASAICEANVCVGAG